MKNKILMILLLLGIIFSTNSIIRTYQHIEKKVDSTATVISIQDSKYTYSYNYNGITYTNKAKLKKNTKIRDEIKIKINPKSPAFSTIKKDIKIALFEIIIFIITTIGLFFKFSKTRIYIFIKESIKKWMKSKLQK